VSTYDDDMPDFVRKVPAWVKGWVVARENDDYRVFAQQRQGYNTLQARSEPGHRTYVWPEQDWMPADEQARYEKLGAHLTFTDVVTGMARRPGRAVEADDLMALLGEV